MGVLLLKLNYQNNIKKRVIDAIKIKTIMNMNICEKKLVRLWNSLLILLSMSKIKDVKRLSLGDNNTNHQRGWESCCCLSILRSCTSRCLLSGWRHSPAAPVTGWPETRLRCSQTTQCSRTLTPKSREQLCMNLRNREPAKRNQKTWS